MRILILGGDGMLGHQLFKYFSDKHDVRVTLRQRLSYIKYENVRVPADHLLGKPGGAFVIAQTRLGGGRIHHAMRTIAVSQKALDMMCERALSREVSGGLLAEKQFVQRYIADSYAQLIQFRLFVLYTAWEIDKYNDYEKVR